MTDMWDARRGAPNGATPKILTYTGAERPVDFQQNVATPPDPSGAVNASFIVESTNDFLSVYDKTTGTVLVRGDAKAFWLYAGIPDGAWGVVDPRVVFIPDAGRYGQWLAVELDLGNRVLVATTSPDAPPNEAPDFRYRRWKGAAFDFPGNDFTMLGYDAKWIYIGTNVASAPGRVPKIAVIPRAKALAWPPQVGPGDVTFIGPLDPKVYGIYPYPVIAPAGDGTFGLAIGIDTVTKSHLTWSLISNGTIMDHDKIEVPPFYTVPAGYMLKQPYDKDGNLSRVVFDNDGVVAAPMADGSNVWLAHTISSTPVNRGPDQQLGVRWYRLAIDSVSRRPSLAKCGVIGYPCYDYFNPSILSFGKDDYTILSVSRSGDASTSSHPQSQDCGNIGAYAVMIRETANDYWYEVFTLRSGQANNYIPEIFKQRWGDYSTICRDPANPRTAWIFNHYVTQGGPSTSRNCDVMARMDLPPP
jgi:hypothetical protein